ncbi:Homoserine dehydrogenase [Tieghemiomyces parasiticus]|uniref:Homoserine dehydrogenase n=1 Tax=Tieghemiomyces parasiticus TaxID=78921 RepID=A0A9W8DV45_9FUNG|nr:Homoserine dehydrogenase [Tieghemiomyces parasiticus]
MVNVAVVGPGLVGQALIQQLLAHEVPGLALPLVGVINSRRMLTHSAPSGHLQPLASPGQWAKQLADAEAADLKAFVTRLAATPGPSVIVDCTSSLAIAELYPAWLAQGLHVVTPNKKGFSSQYELYAAIRAQTGPRRPLVYHESTVGAGLPVLNTLYDLVRTGDEIVRIEGVFSGTLSYLFNTFSSAGGNDAQAFSAIVAGAKALGYTEPDPRDDLNGLDVARKVVILARVAGLALSLEDLDVENIVPAALRTVATADEFMAQLPASDDHFTELNREAAAAGTVLRYVGTVDPRGRSSVKLVRYPFDHPFAGLKGSDNIIAFTTKRFASPLIIQGAGAGAAVTAFGIFADLIKVAERTA